MKVLIGNLPWIAERSIRNCHCAGVDSVLFNDRPEHRVRMFVARENHELWRNQFPFTEKLSVGLHPHHCNVELRPIFGEIWNVVRRPKGDAVRLDCFRYNSPSGNNARGSFKREYMGAHFCLEMEQLSQRNALVRFNAAMPAQAIHTVYVPKGESAAWFVHEGREDKDYQPFCWSNDDLEKFDFDRINHPMSTAYLRRLLAGMPDVENVVHQVAARSV